MPRIQKGETRNPKGRPKKGQALSELLAAKLDKDAFVDRLIDFAMNASPKDAGPYIKLIIEYIDGKPVQPIQQDSVNRVIVEYADADDPA